MQPNLFFQNAVAASQKCQLRTSALPSASQQLPREITFYLRLKHVNCSFPLPRRVGAHDDKTADGDDAGGGADRFVLKASVVEGHEEAGPVAHVPFDCAHVIGLQPHMLLSLIQIVLEVPSTPTVNPDLLPTSITFRERRAQRRHARGAGERTQLWTPSPTAPPHAHVHPSLTARFQRIVVRPLRCRP